MRNKRLALGLRGVGGGISPVSVGGLMTVGQATAGGLAAACLLGLAQPANAAVIACNPNASSAASGCTTNGGFLYPATDGTGYYSNVTGTGATGAGLSAATVYGSYASVTGARATAIGLGATAGQGAIAIGSQQFTGQDAATGAPTGGTPTTASGLNSIALGTGAAATANYAIAQGFGASAGAGGTTSGGLPTGGIAIGTGAVAGADTAGTTLAIGNYATATAPAARSTGDSVAIGTQTTANAVDSIAIGAQTTASAVNTIAIGNNNTATAGANSVVLGVASTISAAADGSTVLGSNSAATAANTTVVGRAASASVAGGVALGNGSTATRAALAGGAELFSQTAVASTNGAVSVGVGGAERQIVNVAGGTQATDAVNVRQLRAVSTNLATSLGGGAGFDATTGAYTAPAYTVGGQTYNNVGAALTAGNALAVQYTPDATGAATNVVDLTKGGTLNPVTMTGLANATTATGAVTLGQMPLQYSTAAAPTTANPAVPSNDVTLVGANAGAPISLHNLAAGTIGAASTDAVNGSQLYGTAASVATALGGGAGVAADGTVSAPTYTVAGATYNNVGSAIGAIDTGLTNGQVGAFRSDNSAGAAAPVDTGANSVAGGFGASATGAASTVVGNGATDNGNAASTVVGNGASVAAGLAGSNVALGQGSTVTAAAVPTPNATIGGIGYTFAGGAPAGAVSVGAAGAERQIQNVAAGQLTAGSTDAVNGSQLYATNTQVTTNTTAIAGLTNGTSGLVQQAGPGAPITVGAGTDGTSVDLTNNAGATRTLTGVTAGAVNATSVDAINGSQLYGTAGSVATALGGGSVVNGDGTVSAPAYMVGGQTYGNVGSALAASNALGVQYTPDATGAPTNAVDLTKGGTLNPVGVTGLANATTATGAVTLGQTPLQYSTAAAPTTANPAVPSNDVTLVGANAGAPVAVHNVADGTLAAGSTDAVNGGQLYTTNQNVAALTNGTAGLVQQADPNAAITVGAASGGTVVRFANAAGAARTLTGVAAGTVGAGSTDAINGSQLASTAGSVATALGGGAAVAPDGTISAPTYNVANGSYNDVGSALTALDTGISSGRLGAFVSNNTSGRAAPSATGADASAGGFGASATGANSVVLGGNATDNGSANATILGSNGSVTQDGGVALGAGSTATRAALAGATEAFSGTAVGSTQGAVSVGAVGAERQITNVAGGTQDTDAVNLRQLRAVGTNVATSLGGGAGFDAATGAYTAPAYTVGGQTYNDVGSALTASNNLSVQYTPDGTGAATNTIDLTKGGTLNPVTVTGLAPGALTATSTDAVNGSQLYATNQQLAAIAGGTAGLVQQDPATRAITVGAATDGTTVGFANNSGAARTLTGVAAGNVAVGSTEAVNGGQLAGTAASVAGALGGGAAVNADGTVSAPTYAVNGQNYNNVGGAITALDSTGVKYDTAPGGGKGQSITLAGGDPNQPVVIHNVGAGVARTDAANVGQVQDAETRANAYTNQRVAGIQNQIGGMNDRISGLQSDILETKREARQGAAIGLAAASLRYDDRPGKVSVAAGAGYWRGEAAGAFGLGYTLPDGRFRVNGTVATTGSAVGAGAGATYTFN